MGLEISVAFLKELFSPTDSERWEEGRMERREGERKEGKGKNEEEKPRFNALFAFY